MAEIKSKKGKLLVANRSEIACRIFQACREMGISTVAVVAPGDEQGRHVTYADEVVEVSSYLNPAAIVAAAQSVGATLVHPGYGFLSERSVFANAVEAAGIAFVGPRGETMDLLGGKIAAKELAERIGVPTLPWAKVKPNGDWKAAALKVGFPLLLKAAAGGGGKGMRRVDRAEDLDSAAESASAEAVAAFGDGTLFLERLVDHPRHIEVQVFGDGMGGGVHLYERECTLQRRHQKIWEEARAENLADSVKEGLHTAALKLVREVKYRSAGTIEFLVDDQGGFYFLEMNTRLQVEHPVTECVTGVDLVHAQIRQALNPKKPALPEVPVARGHSLEVRIYAEDPAQGFLPTPGTVERLRWPTGAWIRVESGIEEGQTIGTSFDSMLGKLVVWAENRELAIERLRVALEETVILGLGTNQAYLLALCSDPDVRAGKVHTHWLEKTFASRYQAVPSETDLALWSALRKQGLGAAVDASSSAPRTGVAASGQVSPWQQIGAEGLKP